MSGRYRAFLIFVVLAGLVLCGTAFSTPVSDPQGYWNLFNVYSFNNIGVSNGVDTTGWYTSDFEGAAGAGGNAYFVHMGMNLLGQYSHGGRPFALYTGGDAFLMHGDLHGGVEAGGNVNLQHFTADGDIRAQAGTVTTGGGTPALNNQIHGSVYADGGLLSGVDIGGDLDSTSAITLQDNSQVFGTAYHSGNVTLLDTSGVAATNPGASPNATTHTYLDHSAVQSYFQTLSQNIAAMPDQNATVVINPPSPPWKSAVHITVTGGALNVVNLDAAQTNDFINAGVISVTSLTGPDAVLYINLTLSPGATFDFGAIDFQLNNVEHGNVIINFPQPSGNTVDIFQATFPNLLMPYADVEFYDGLLVGRLIVGNLEGSGQVNLPGGYIPEPATLTLLVSGISGMAVMRLRKRRKRS